MIKTFAKILFGLLLTPGLMAQDYEKDWAEGKLTWHDFKERKSTKGLSAQNIRDTTNIRPLNNFNLNILGEASLISINYERLFFINSRLFLTCRLGIGYNLEYVLFNTSPPENYMIISQHITGNLGKEKWFLEFGLSGAIVNKHYLLGPMVGLRIQPLKSNKVNFRLYGILPVIGPLRDMDIFYIPVGLSLGISF